MFRKIVFSSFFAALSFASVGVQATPQRIAMEGGSFGFNVYPQCSGSQQYNNYQCRRVCVGFPAGYCGISYQQSTVLTPDRKAAKQVGVVGFTQGKFRAN